MVSEGTLTAPVRHRDGGDPQPRTRAPASPPRPGAGDVHRRARRVPPLRPQRQRARRGAPADRTARRRRRGTDRRTHATGQGAGRVRGRPSTPTARWPPAGPPPCCGCAASAASRNSVPLAVAAYVAAAAMLVVPTVALAVPWLTELHRLIAALDSSSNITRHGRSTTNNERLPVSSLGIPTRTAQIGVTGLAVMGSNIARNFAHHGYTVALHNRSIAKTDALLEAHGSEGKFVRSETIPEFLAALEKPRRVMIMVKAGDPTDAVINELADAMEQGDIIIDGGNCALHRHHPSREGDPRARAALRRRRHLRRRGGRAQRAVDHARRSRRVLRIARPAARGDLRPRRRRALLHAHRPRRLGALREDGAQRHRVLRHAAHRRGLPAAARRPWQDRARDRRHLRRVEQGRPGQLPDRDHRRGAQARSTPRPASRWSTSSSTRPSRRAPAAGRSSPRSTSACRSPASPRPCSPARCPVRSPSARPPPAWPPAISATKPDRRSAVHRRREQGAVRVEDHRLRPGLQPDPGRQQRVRLGHHPR